MNAWNLSIFDVTIKTFVLPCVTSWQLFLNILSQALQGVSTNWIESKSCNVAGDEDDDYDDNDYEDKDCDDKNNDDNDLQERRMPPYRSKSSQQLANLEKPQDLMEKWVKMTMMMSMMMLMVIIILMVILMANLEKPQGLNTHTFWGMKILHSSVKF